MPENTKQVVHTKVTERDIETYLISDSNRAWNDELLELKDRIMHQDASTDLIQEAFLFLEHSTESDTFDVNDPNGEYGMSLINRGNHTITGTLWSNYDYNYDCSIQVLDTTTQPA